jgi:hypothetical protein
MAVCSPETVRFETAIRRHLSIKYYSYLLRLNNTPIHQSFSQSIHSMRIDTQKRPVLWVLTDMVKEFIHNKTNNVRKT